MGESISGPWGTRGPGHYRLIKYIGSGGFATTYLAEDAHGAQVAVKALNHRPIGQREALERFRRELESGEKINSKFVARVLDFDLSDDPPWIAFTYVAGRDLRDLVHEAPLDVGRVARLAVQLANALADLDRYGVVHRDLKPENIRVGAGDTLTVIDLGIAWSPEQPTLTRLGSAPGTLAYMPPESFDPGDPTPAWDVWAYGLILAQITGGAHPFGRAMGSTGYLLSAIRDQDPDLSGVPWPWSRICELCLSRDPAHRPRSGPLALMADQATLICEWWSAEAEQWRSSSSASAWVASFLAAARSFTLAASSADLIEDPERRALKLGDIAAAQAKAGQTDAANTVLADAKLSAGLVEDLGRRARTLAQIASAVAGAGMTTSALEIVEIIDDLEAAGLIRSTYGSSVLTDVAAAFARSGRLSVARQFFAAAREAATDDWMSLGRIAAAQTQAGQTEDATKTAGLIEEPEHRARSFTKVGDIQAATLQGDAARQTFTDAKESARHIESPSRRARGLEAVAAAQARAGELKAAAETLAEAMDAARLIAPPGTRARQVADITADQTKIGDVSAQPQSAVLIGDRRDWVPGLVDIAAAQAQAGQTRNAVETLAEAKESARLVGIPGGSLRAWALVQVAEAQAQAGQTENAVETLAEAKKVAELAEDPQDRRFDLRMIATELVKTGQIDEALETVALSEGPVTARLVRLLLAGVSEAADES